jgi:hypothetical protein
MTHRIDDWRLALRATWRLLKTRQLVETLEWVDAEQQARGR